jgi:TolB protein
LVYESYTSTLSTLPASASEVTATPPVTVTIPNLEILIRPAAGDQPAVRLTDNPAADFAPAWSPSGRQIAFVSNRTGENEIWLADLDRIADRFRDVSQDPQSNDTYPAWSPDGTRLAWATSSEGYQNIVVLDASQAGATARLLGSGDHPAWDHTGDIVLTSLQSPNQTYLTAYHDRSPGLALPSVALPGEPDGLSWGRIPLPNPLPASMRQVARINPTPPWQPVLTPAAEVPAGRQRVVPLTDVQAPYSMLADQVDESFNALRKEAAARLGWDFLSTLENAYVPLTSPLFPGLLNDWLYTGRAIVVNTAPVNAGWMLVTREDFGPSTYWRVYLRTRFQDGSQGKPLWDIPWDLNARYGGDPRFYEQGGALARAIPPGYWLDFTALAASYGWQRLPALSTWRSAFPAARYNEFVHTSGLDWFSAMVEIYPVEAVYTPTPVQPPTFTPTTTRRPTRTPTPTRTRFPTRTPTVTSTSTLTPTITSTRLPPPPTPTSTP